MCPHAEQVKGPALGHAAVIGSLVSVIESIIDVDSVPAFQQSAELCMDLGVSDRFVDLK
jgi:hypothetical protein